MAQANLLPGDSIIRLGNGDSLSLANRLASEAKRRWRHGEPPDVAAVLAQHPELKRYKSVVLDLAHDEYRHRLEAGESLDADQFSRRFPTLQKSLYLLIEVHKLLSQDPCFRSLQESVPWPEPGQSFLGFSLLTELGRGTFGRVFLASEPALGDRLVALKVAPQGSEEAEMLGKLQHPNIVPVYSVREDGTTGLTAVCMPYSGRVTLADVLDRAFANSRLPTRSQAILDAIQHLGDDPNLLESPTPDRVLRKGSYVDGVIHLAVQLADALAYTHSRGICHRDLKPSNVLISPDGRPLLLDFNLSFDEQVSTSRIGGTLPYMAPEQLRLIVLESPAHQSRPDPRSDLFSIGVIIYELLSGSLPFGAIPWDCPIEQLGGHLLRQQEKGPRPIRDKNEQVDKPLAQLIGGCLAFDPERRPESASALAAAFRKQLAPVQRGKRWVRNHRRRVSAIVAVLLTLALAGGSFLALRDPYSVRQFKHGLEYSKQGRYELAVDYFDEAIRSNLEYSEALFSRGRAYQRLKNYRQAADDFHAAFRLSGSPRAAACWGYCLSKLKYHGEAVRCYRNAMDLGLDSPAVLNNIGFSYIQLNRPDEAEEYLRQAIEGDEALQAAHHNLLLVFLKRARHGQPVPRASLLHAEKAIESGPPSAELYHDAAALYALAAKEDSGLIRPSIEYLENAIAHGLDPRLLKPNPAFSRLHKEQAFNQLLTRAARTKPPIKPERLVDPL